MFKKKADPTLNTHDEYGDVYMRGVCRAYTLIAFPPFYLQRESQDGNCGGRGNASSLVNFQVKSAQAMAKVKCQEK